MQINYHSRNRLSEDQEEGAIYHNNIEDLLAESEFLSLHSPV